MKREVELEAPQREVELDEALELGPDNLGESVVVTGTVVGTPTENGFFLQTEDDRVIFVQAGEDEVFPADIVTIIGVLSATDEDELDVWEDDAFQMGFEPEWEVVTDRYIDATSVTPE